MTKHHQQDLYPHISARRPSPDAYEDDGFRQVKVTVYVLKVQNQQKHWKEVGERKRRWLSISQAAELVQEPALATVIKRLKRTAARKRPLKLKA